MVEETRRRRTSASPPEEPSFSSPPCFMHELRPEYLGYMSEAEVEDLITELRSLWKEAKSSPGTDGEAARRALDERCRECLPRIYPCTLRDEIESLLAEVEEQAHPDRSCGEE